MKSPLQLYKDAKNKAVLRKDCFTYFNQKYFKKPFEEYDLFETDERMAVRKLKFFIPGRIYTWQYDPLMKDVLDFYDRRPMVLVHSAYVAKTTGNLIVQGLNLNFLPEMARVQTLETFYRVYKDDVNAAYKSVDEGKIGLLKQAWKYLTDWYFTINVFNKQGKIGYQWAYRNYIIPRIKNPVIIEMEDWEMIPYFVPKEFQGKAPAQIWGEYLKYKSELLKLKVDQESSKKNQKKYKKPGS
jgi:hypothetical protein